MKLLAPSKEGFETLLRLARGSFAEPPTFASIVDAEENQEALTVVFHIGRDPGDGIRVDLNEQRLQLTGMLHGRRARRVCTLPLPVSSKLDVTRSGDRLFVRLPKKDI